MTKSLIDVGGENAKLTSLRQTTGDLSGILEETPSKTLAFSLAVFDPKVLEADPRLPKPRRRCEREGKRCIVRRPSSFPPTCCSVTRSTTSSVSICRHRTGCWRSASPKSAKSKYSPAKHA